MKDGRKVCPKDCPERSAECRLTCERWAAHREERLKVYDERAKAIPPAYWNNPSRQAEIRKNLRCKMRRRHSK